jgi:RHS repeat-associated protein
MPLAITHSATGSPIVDLTYSVASDGSGLIGGKEDRIQPNWSEAYSRDNRERLVEYRRGLPGLGGSVPTPDFHRQYALDGVGNFSQVTTNGVVESRSHNAVHQLVAIDGEPLLYDGRGNLVDDGELLYAYNFDDQLVQVDRKSTGELVARYAYDALGHRVRKELPGLVIEYVYDGPRIIEEIRNGLTWATFVYVNGPEEIVQADINGQAYFFHRDGLGSIVAVTDAFGGVVERYRYTPYGEVEAFESTGSPVAIGLNEHLFTGLQYDPETGLYHVRYRYYNPRLGRFMSRDPLGIFRTGGIVGLYSYAELDPTTFVDRTGLAATKVCSGHRIKIGVPDLGLPKIAQGLVDKLKIKGELLLEYRTCERCCRGTNTRVTEKSGQVTANLVWTSPCFPVPSPFGPLGVKFPDGGCAGVYGQLFVKFGGRAFWQENKCGLGCKVGGCLVGTVGLWIRGGYQGSFGSAWAGGSLSGSGQFCATGTCSGTGPTIQGQVCVNGKVSVRFELKKWWVFSSTGGIYYEYIIWQGSACTPIQIL